MDGVQVNVPHVPLNMSRVDASQDVPVHDLGILY